jgi:hypothetical protein
VNYQVGYQASWDDASKERMDRFVITEYEKVAKGSYQIIRQYAKLSN